MKWIENSFPKSVLKSRFTAFNFQNKSLVLKSTVLYMTTFDEKVDELPKETKKGMKNSKTIGDVAGEVVKNFNYFQLKIQDLEDRLKKLEWKPKSVSKPPDENDSGYKNRRDIYLGKLNDKMIKEPKQSTLDYYKVKY